jgi:Tol biopolymer transport system component
MTPVIRERALFRALLLGFTAAACDNTALVGAEPPKTDSGPGNTTNISGSAGATGGVAGADGGVVGSLGGAAGTNAVVVFEGVTGGTGTPMSGPWLFFDSMRGLNRDIYAILADGTSLKRVTTSPTTEQEPSVSPDGTTLAFSSDADGTFQIYLMPLPAGAVRPLTHHKGGAGQPAWSPDGKQLVFFSGMGLSIIGSDGQNDHSVVLGVGVPDQHGVFAPGGHAIVFDRGNQIHQFDLDTGVETSVVKSWTTNIEHPSVSPDGYSIAYNVSCDSSGDSIWISPLAADTLPCMGGARVTTPAESPVRFPVRFPSFSPDGLIAVEHGAGAARIGIVSPGGAVMDVTHGEGDDRNPSWSPAGLVLP